MKNKSQTQRKGDLLFMQEQGDTGENNQGLNDKETQVMKSMGGKKGRKTGRGSEVQKIQGDKTIKIKP